MGAYLLLFCIALPFCAVLSLFFIRETDLRAAARSANVHQNSALKCNNHPICARGALLSDALAFHLHVPLRVSLLLLLGYLANIREQESRLKTLGVQSGDQVSNVISNL